MMDCRAKNYLYIKANGEIPCYCDLGEWIILYRLGPGQLHFYNIVRDVINGPPFIGIRYKLLNNELPFPNVCPACAMFVPGEEITNPSPKRLASYLKKIREHPYLYWKKVKGNPRYYLKKIKEYLLPELKGSPTTISDARLRTQRVDCLQIEPSFLCNLDCPSCAGSESFRRSINYSPFKRKETKSPPYNMPKEMFKKIIDDLHNSQITIGWIDLEGRGEPLMNKDIFEMIRYAKGKYDCPIVVVTHANFKFNEEIVESGLDKIIASVDGARQSSYERYRKGGDLQKALNFMRHIVSYKKLKRMNTPQVVWKYILFEWNDSDEEIIEAQRYADEIEVDEILFVRTRMPDPGYSTKYFTEDDLLKKLPRVTKKLTFGKSAQLLHEK